LVTSGVIVKPETFETMTVTVFELVLYDPPPPSE